MHKTVPMLAVDSSLLAQIGHDFFTKTLRVRFANRKDGTPGALYEYENVSAEKYEQFRNAKSKGIFFTEEIKNHPELYRYKKLEPISAPDACAAVATMASAEELTAYMEALPVPVRTDYRVESAVASRLAFFKIARTTAAQA